MAGLRVCAQAPDDYFTDSLKKRLAGAQAPAEKVQFLMALALSVQDSTQAESYAWEALTDAELSRDRSLMASAYINNGARYLNNQGLVGSLAKSRRAFEQAVQVAKEGGLSWQLTDSYGWLSALCRAEGDNEKALGYSNLAMAVAVNTDNDTAKVRAYVSLGDVYREMKNMPLAFQHYSEALSIAEEGKNAQLTRNVYWGLNFFYAAMHEYGKAIDETMKAYALDRKLWDGNYMLRDLNRVGELFGLNKQNELAFKVYEQSLALADTLHYGLFKTNCYFRIFNLYYQGKQYVKAQQYLLSRPEMLNYLAHFGYSFYPFQIRAAALTEEGRYDSALYYFRESEPLIAEKANYDVKVGFYQSFGDYFISRKQYPEAIGYYKKAFNVVAAAKDQEYEEIFADTLRSLYERAGDWRAALEYNRLAGAERDSLRAKTQETELMKLEVDTENRRKDRAAREDEQNMERRHNIQYMGFTAGLVLLFLSIVLLGRLRVPVSVIRTVVFLSFIFLFEFIILLLDRRIQAWTHDEPWKVLCIKIVLAAGLVPLHHWLEHQVIHYLSRRHHKPATVPAHKNTSV
ncbi:MAG TPA: tetratricopeptide repeat protein [Puia sp.]